MIVSVTDLTLEPLLEIAPPSFALFSVKSDPEMVSDFELSM